MSVLDPAIRISAAHPLVRGPAIESIFVGTPTRLASFRSSRNSDYRSISPFDSICASHMSTEAFCSAPARL
jgi:hypothetical protein